MRRPRQDSNLGTSVMGCKSKAGGEKRSLDFRGPFRDRTGPAPSGPLGSFSPGPTCVWSGVNLGLLRRPSVGLLFLDTAGPRWPGHRHGGWRARWVPRRALLGRTGRGFSRPGEAGRLSGCPGGAGSWVSAPGIGVLPRFATPPCGVVHFPGSPYPGGRRLHLH